MMKMGSLRRNFGFICLFLFILSMAITITINSVWLYRLSIESFTILEMTHLTKVELLRNYHLLLNYLNFPWVETLNLPDFPMSKSGLQHFVDVKKLFLFNYEIGILTVAPSIQFIREIVKEHAYWRMIRPFQMAMVIPIAFSCLMVLGFDRFFITFHELFFRNSDWQFDPTKDPIINVLPEGFFMYCFILFFVLLETCFLLSYLYFSYKLKKDMQKKE